MKKLKRIICAWICMNLIFIQAIPSVLLEVRAAEMPEAQEQESVEGAEKETENVEETTDEAKKEDSAVVGETVGEEEKEVAEKSGKMETVSLMSSNAEFEYSISDEGVTITKYLGNGGKVVIPEEIENYKVIKIGDYAFEKMSGITEVAFPEGIIGIGDNAFESCSGLTNLKLPDSIIEIGIKAFENCTGITEVKLPSSLEKMSYRVFSNTSIKEIVIPKSLKSVRQFQGGPFADCADLKKAIIEEGTTIVADNLFYDAKNLETIIFSSTVTKLGAGSFENCSSLTNLELPDSIIEIGTEAFQNCTGITEVELPSSLEKMGYRVFSNTSIKEIVIPRSLKSVQQFRGGPFADCANLKKAIIEEGTTTVADDLFCDAKALESVIFPSTVTKLGVRTFENCSGLTNLELPDSITEIGTKAFENCTGITEVTLPSSLERMGYRVFSNTSIKEIVIPKNLKETWSFGGGPFADCVNLRKAIIEEGTTIVADDLFCDAKTLETVIFPSTVTKLGVRTFENCSGLTNLELPDSITEIGTKAFENCTGITEIKLPSSLKKIAYGAFSNTSIREIMIPKNLAETNGTMGGPFENCPYLKKVTVEEGVTTIGWRLFYHIESLESVSLPSTVTKVEAEAFGGCPNLTNLQLPDSLTTIANNAFDNSPNIKLYCNYGTLTHFYFIEQRKPINLTSHAYTDFNKLAIENDSYYEVDYNGLSSNGCVNVKLYYHIKEEQFNDAADKYICIVVPENTEIFEGVLYVDGVLCSEQFMEGIRCKIPVQKSSGTITFSFKPQASRELFNCAYYEYRTENEIKKEMLGYENSVRDFLTVSAKSTTSNPEIVVSGIGPKESEIELYINEVLQKSVITSKTGKYQTALELPNPVNGMYYLIEARCADDSEQKASAAIRYNEGQPEVTEFKLYYNNQQNMDLLNNASSPYISFNPVVPFTFTAKFDNGDKLENVYVVSTRNNERKVMEATYDDKTERYVASGYFDDNNHNYVPGKITLEYNYGTEVSKVGEEIDWEAKYDLLSDDMKKTAVTSTGNEKDMTYSFDLSEVSEGLKDVGLDLTVSSFDEATDGNLGQWLGISEEYFNLASYVVPGINGEKYLVTTDFSDPKTYFMWIKDTTGAANNFTKLKVSMQSAGEWTNLNELTSHLNVVAKGAGAAYDIYNFGVERNELVNEIMQSPNIQNKGTAIRKANELYDNQIMYTLLAAALPLVITTIGISGPVGIGFSALMGVIGVSSSFFWAARVANIKGEAIQIRWGIDPSGYVYEAVKENRLKDVKATVYYKANLEDEESVLWDASEYEQENPLYTGADGGYAWDVPEGYWKVVFEKEGYEPTETDWLCVPPPQTNINVCMISKERPVIESLDIYPDYAKLVFSKYMKPDSVGTLKLSDENGKDIRYSIEYDRNAVDSEGVNYAREYILRYQADKILESGSSCKLISDGTTKSYADIAMESSEVSAQVKKNIQFIVPEEVTVKMGDSLDIPVYIANSAENIKFTAASDFEDIVVVEKTDTDYVHVSGKLLGTANVTLSIPGTDIKKIIKVNVGESTEKVELETTVVLPQSVYVAFIDEDIEIMPEIYPDSTLNGKWETEGAEDIVSIKGNIFHAEKRGMVMARYRLDNAQEIYAECKIVVKAETEPGDINEDGNIDLFDLMLCLNHVAKKSVLEGNAFEAADVDESERVDLFDLMRILNYVAKKKDTV